MPPGLRPSVLLVNYAGYMTTSNTFVPDNSLAALAGSLLANGIETRILDFQNAADIGSIGDLAGEALGRRVLGALEQEGRVERDLYRSYRARRDAAQRAREAQWQERLLAAVAEQRATLVGFKLWAGTGLSAILRMAEALRAAHPELRIVVGGPAVTLAQQRIVRRSRAIDHVVVGDGERAIVELASGGPADALLALGRRTRRGGGIAQDEALDALPAAVYANDVYPGLDRFFSLRVIDESRGCFNRCAFCAHPQLSGVTRLRSPARVVDEMEQALASDGIHTFRFSGSNPPWKHLRAIAAEIRRRRLPVQFSAFSSMNNTRAEDMEELAAAGLRALFFGIESADPEVLRRAHHKNNVSNAHVVEVVRAASDAGIFSCLSAIVPSPFESADSRKKTLELLCRVLTNGGLGSAIVLPALLVPGSAWWNSPEQFGFELTNGTDRDTLLDRLLDWDDDFLLPRELVGEVGFSLDGKSSSELFDECGAFARELSRAGVPTNLDDASYMIALATGMTAEAYQRAMLGGLVVGGAERLLEIVRRRASQPTALSA